MSIFEPSKNLGNIEQNETEWNILDESSKPEDKQVSNKSNLRLFGIILTMVSLIFINRLAFLQITEGANNSLLAEGNRIRGQVIQPPRGLITDRFGNVLAKNIAAFAVEIMPIDLPRTQSERLEVYSEMTSIFNTPIDELIEAIEEMGLRSINPVIIKENIEHDEALNLKIALKDIPGVRVVKRPIREYIADYGLSHILGYTGKVSREDLENSDLYNLQSIVGKTGIEKSYEQELYGLNGLEQIEVDSKGYYQRTLSQKDPTLGKDVALSINLELQEKLGTELEKMLEEKESPAGVGIILNPQNGQIKAMVSLPEFDNNEFAKGITPERYQELLGDEQKLFLNRAIAGVYPSGSVIKPFVAAAALKENIVTPNQTINAPAAIHIGRFTFPDWRVHGVVDIKRALAVSSNIFFYAVGGGWQNIQGLGVDKIGEYLRLFGFGGQSGVDIGGEQTGLVPNNEWKRRVQGEPWYIGDTYHLSIGQGNLLTTPMQIARANMAIANGGYLYEPQLILKTTSPDNKDEQLFEQEKPKQVLDIATLEVVRQGMREAVEYGSARFLQDLPVTSAGKTGTAQFGTEGKTHAWFTGFAPYENPEVAILVLVEAGGGGHEAALPVALETLKWYFAQDENKR